MLWMTSIFLFGMVTAASAVESEWLWQGTGTAFEFNLQYDPTSEGTDSFWITSTNKNDTINRLLLLTETSKGTSVKIYKDNPSNHFYADNTKDGLGPIDLGANPQFYFSFAQGDDPNIVFSYMYNLVQDDDMYYLSKSGNKIEVGVGSCCGISPSPVPIPGSALLLGSSLLGLVGIGSRRKKA
jgi:hypothetical protein